MKKKISVVIPVYNNIEEFNATINSLGNLITLVNIIIIDSSNSWPINTRHKNHLKNSIWVNPKGIYPALNIGIKSTNTEYIQILNSGDLLIQENFESLLNDLENDPDIDVIVCSQITKHKSKQYIYIPKKNGIWPHQSVIYKTKIHKDLGLYNTNWKIISDQLFFNAIQKNKKKYKIVFVNNALTIYDVTGMSSKTDRNTVHEIKYLNNVMGKSNIRLYLKLFIKYLSQLLKLDFDLFWMNIKKQIIYNDK